MPALGSCQALPRRSWQVLALQSCQFFLATTQQFFPRLYGIYRSRTLVAISFIAYACSSYDSSSFIMISVDLCSSVLSNFFCWIKDLRMIFSSERYFSARSMSYACSPTWDLVASKHQPDVIVRYVSYRQVSYRRPSSSTPDPLN